MSRLTLFADLIMPLSLANLFTYRVPFDMNEHIAPGKRVVVQFGKSKRYAALVRRVHEKPPTQYETKYVEAILDEWPIINETQFKHWEWMCSYYMCNMGEVMVAALPGSLRLASETRIYSCKVKLLTITFFESAISNFNLGQRYSGIHIDKITN